VQDVERHAALFGITDVTHGKPRNLAASVRQRLVNIAKEREEEFQYVLIRYGTERLLYRLSQSEHADVFILKGAALFQIWTNQPHRPTRDVDILGHGAPTLDRFERLLRDVCTTEVEDDGLLFDGNSIVVEQIKEEDEYQGIRLRLVASLQNARISLQIDVGFGDAITPGTEDVVYPTLLEFPPPKIKAYPRETVVAEKFQAMVKLGIANSRMKDYYDLWILAKQFDFDGTQVTKAIKATFERRRTELPSSMPLALTDEFAEDERKQTQWKAFCRKGRLAVPGLKLKTVTELLAAFLMPPTKAAHASYDFAQRWAAGGPWQNMSDEL